MLFTAALANSLTPYTRADSFEDTPTRSPVEILLIVILVLALFFLYSYGAAKLSWNYNMYVGNSTGAAFFNSILAFLFSNFYYPFYAFLLSPVAAPAGV